MSSYKFVTFESGFGVSIQASRRNYCSPRNDMGPYKLVELGFPTGIEPLIMDYAEDASNPTETVYGFVPVGIVKAVIAKHGGIADGEIPPFDMSPEQAGIFAETLAQI